MRAPNSIIMHSIDELLDNTWECALSDFLEEHKLVGEFIIWIEKWKELHKISK